MNISVFAKYMGRQARRKLDIEIAQRCKHEEELFLVAPCSKLWGFKSEITCSLEQQETLKAKESKKESPSTQGRRWSFLPTPPAWSGSMGYRDERTAIRWQGERRDDNACATMIVSLSVGYSLETLCYLGWRNTNLSLLVFEYGDDSGHWQQPVGHEFHQRDAAERRSDAELG
jgi:hypothetical protein